MKHHRGSIDEPMAYELAQYAINNGNLYRQQTQPILKNLARKIVKGIYQPELALKLWGYLADNAAKHYAKEFNMRGTINVPTRMAAAEQLADYYQEQLTEAIDMIPHKNPAPRRGSGVRIIYNKLLGGWYIVRGPHQTPLGGRFHTKSEAQAHLNRGSTTPDYMKRNPHTRRPFLSVPEQHQLRIARDTWRNPLKGQFLGGPTAEEAREIIIRLTGKDPAMKKNPQRRRSKKPSPAQLAARKKFIAMVRARAKNRRKPARMKVTQHRRGTATRYKFSRPVTRAQAEAMIAQHKAPRRRRAMRRNPQGIILCLVRRDGSRWYWSVKSDLTNMKRDAQRFSSEERAMNIAKDYRPALRKMKFVRAHTERA